MTHPKTRAAAAVVVLLGCLAACSSDDGPEPAVDAFLGGWRNGTLDASSYVGPDGRAVSAAEVASQLEKLSGNVPVAPAKLERLGDAVVDGGTAVSTVRVDRVLPGGAHWRYDTSVRLRERDGEWRVLWEPATVHEDLKAGDALALERLDSPRAALLDAAGEPIVKPRPVVSLALDPAEVTDPRAAVEQLAAALATIDTELDQADLLGRLTAAKPGRAVDVVVLRREAFDTIASALGAVTGVVAAKSTLDLAPTRQFARAVLGSVSEVTKDDLDENPGEYLADDLIGHGGLQAAYEDRLRGVPGLVVSIRPAAGTPATEVTRIPARAGAPVRTTLDPRIQTAAETALGGIEQASALVAVNIRDGSVVAAANGPDGGSFNVAFEAEVPPGSTFKMVSALGLLDRGAVRADTTVACPSHLAAGDRDFTNFDGFQLGDVPFRTDFAKSCNTAFVKLSPGLGPDGLADAGRSVGLGSDYRVGLPAFTGAVSTGGDAAERAAAAFGQGRTVVSPLAMASATAAVASGRWRQPTLVTDPVPAAVVAPGPVLRPGSVEPLRAMMRQVVTDGTATSLRTVPGEPVYGKTGTAEFDDNPDHAHAWWIGWQGDIAFAVFVESGGHSSSVSVPVAEKFLRALNS